MMSQRYAQWRLDSCEVVTSADHPTFFPRGDLWASIVRGDGVVRGEKMWQGGIREIFHHTCGQPARSAR